MEEAPENGKESPHSAHANGMNECPTNRVPRIPSYITFVSHIGDYKDCCLLRFDMLQSVRSVQTFQSNVLF